MKTQMEVVSNKNAEVVTALQQVLADTYALYFKTHSYHWNVEGIHFHALHALFEEQYTEMWQAIDEIAERIRALDAYAPANYDEMVANTRVVKDVGVPNAQDMIQNLIAAHGVVIESAKEALAVAQESEDEVSSDTCLARMNIHEKTLWMLKSLQK